MIAYITQNKSKRIATPGRAWRYQKGKSEHNGQKEKVQKDKQRSTKHIYKTKDQATRTPRKYLPTTEIHNDWRDTNYLNQSHYQNV